MPLTRQSLSPVLLLLAVAAAGFGIWALLGSEDEGPALEEDAGTLVDLAGSEGDAPPDPSAAERGAPTATKNRGRGLPRVLPPDAAVEDVRDALALAGVEREQALAKARASIARLAVQGEKVLNGLRRYVASVEDPVVRGVVTSALGRARDEENLRWLTTRLAKAATSEERIGALIALADPGQDEGDAAAIPPGSARSTLLGDMPYTYVALPTSRLVLKSGTRFLDTSAGASAKEALPVLSRAIEVSPKWAALLVEDGERMCAWYRALSEESRREVRAVALKHKQLPRDTRRRIRAAD